MPFFWISEGSNFVAIKFTAPTTEKVAETFASPASTDNIDKELLTYLEGMKVGDAIEISLKDSGLKTERSLKVRVNKHAKLAHKELEYRTASDGSFLFRVSALIENTNSAPVTATTSDNGTANIEPSIQEPEVAGNRRNR
jgi:hypothetical protein